MELNKDDYEYWGQWKQPVLSAWFWVEWNKTPALRELNPRNIKFHPFLILDGHFWKQNPDPAEIRKIAEDILENGTANEYLAVMSAVFNKYEKRYLAILNDRDAAPLEYVKNLFEESANIAAIWSLTTFLTDDLGKVALEKGFVKSEKELLDRVQKATPRTWLEEQNLEIKEFADDLRSADKGAITLAMLNDDPGLKNKIENHVKEFTWFGTHHWMGEGYNMNKCLDQINDVLKNPPKEVEEEKSINEADPVINLIAAGVYCRTHCAELTAKVVYGSRGALETIGRSAGLAYDELIYLSGPEILSISAASDEKSLKQTIATRKNSGYGCVAESAGVKIVTGDELRSLVALLHVQEDVKGISEFKGSVASAGPLINGTVKIILSPADFGKFINGEILVVPETTPDYVPLMKKAIAIITDKGGITSHAAIVSRELKIPCIIGTKIATQVLKDGDFVRVDTNKGLVEIIK